MGIIAIYRHGLHGLHGKSFLFLTLGLASWFIADISIMYYYYFEEIELSNEFSIADALWFTGYLFLILHLISVIKSIHTKIIPKTLVIVALFIISYITYTIISIGISFEPNRISAVVDNPNELEIVTAISYPILDLCLIIPSHLILANLYHNYENSIPWILSSLSMLFNAIADNGYVHEFVKGHHTSWFWDLFYITDFIVMTSALFWYNKFHISDALRKDMKN